jgi:hypothetical protein
MSGSRAGRGNANLWLSYPVENLIKHVPHRVFYRPFGHFSRISRRHAEKARESVLGRAGIFPGPVTRLEW